MRDYLFAINGTISCVIARDDLLFTDTLRVLDMQFDLSQLSPHEAYKLLSGLVVPRPIALITTLSADGVVNAAPFSFFNLVGSDPPLVVFAPGLNSPHTPANIRHNHEFVVHIVDENIAPSMNLCAIDFPENISEIEAAGFTMTSSTRIAVPRIVEATVALECREHSTILIGNNRMVFGEVVFIHAQDGIVDENNRIVHDKLRPIGRLAGSSYTRTVDTFEIPRLNYDEWKSSQPQRREDAEK